MAVSDLFYIDAAGIHTPDYPALLATMQKAYRGIYGADVNLDPDTQDGAWLSIMTLAMYETMQVAAQVYASFSPLTAQGDALSRIVKLNGIARHVSSYSTCDVVLVGQAGTIISGGIAKDELDQKWLLPATVTIPAGGKITVTATAEHAGSVQAAAGTINRIYTPTRGWQSVSNAGSATPGVPVETDAQLRRRQTYSTMLPGQTVMDGIRGAIASLDGVTRSRGYENDTGQTNALGIPANCIAFVVEGGDAAMIAKAIGHKKSIGVMTLGTTTITIYDEAGVASRISFYRPSYVVVSVEISIKALTGYLSTTGDAIKAAVAAYITGIDIGEGVELTKLYTPANLDNSALSKTYRILPDGVRIKKGAEDFGTSDITVGLAEAVTCSVDKVTLIVS